MSVENPVPEEIHIEDEEIEEEEEDVEEEEEEEETDEVTHGRSRGRGLTLKTLLKEGVLTPGEGTMTINYLGNKFKGDLLPDGRIRSQETNKIFGTPSAWAIYCKKIVNPDKKSGCGWASVRYRGKKLDSYKNNYYRQKRLEFEREGEAPDDEEMTDSESDGPHEQEIVEFELIGNRHPNHDMNTMVELTSFQALGRMQPFNVTMSSSAMAMVDIHAHLTTSEVVGYLAGQWDVTNHNLIVSHALPVRCRLGDGEKGRTVEAAVYIEMEKLNLSLVGWYHTHPFSPPLPSLRDIDSQLEYELKMKGSNDASYTPCIGLIVSPYVRGGGQGASATGFWVMPPPEHKPQEYGRPMSIQFTIVQDAFMPKDTLVHVRDTVKFYKDSPDAVIFSDIFQDRVTYWDKLRIAVRLCVPKDHYAPLIDYLAKLLEFKNYVPEPVATTPVKPPKAPTTALKPPPTPDLIPLEFSVPHTPPQTASDPILLDTDATPRTPTPGVKMSSEEQKPKPVTMLETQLLAKSLDILVADGNGASRFKPEQGKEEASKQIHQEYPQQQQQQHQHQPQHQHPRGSPPPYRPPPLERLHQELKQDSEQQQKEIRDKHIEQQQSHQYQEQQQSHKYQEQQQAHKYQEQQQSHQYQEKQQSHKYQEQQQVHKYHEQQQSHQYQEKQQSHKYQEQHHSHEYQEQQQSHEYQEQQQSHQYQEQQHQYQQYQQQQYQQQPHCQQQQQLEDYHYKQPSNDEEGVKDYLREPPPSYHQQHFKIPNSYTQDPGKTTSYSVEDRVVQDTTQTGDAGHIPLHYPGEKRSTQDVIQVGDPGHTSLHYPEVLSPDPWPPHRVIEPPTTETETREGDVVQAMDVDSQS